MPIKRVITCYDATEAHLLKAQLENEGIECFLTNENVTNLMLPYFNYTQGGGINIFTDESDYDKARELLKDEISPTNQQIVCPKCGSKNVGLNLGKKKRGKFFLFLIAILFLLPIGNIKPKYYCKDCKEEIS